MLAAKVGKSGISTTPLFVASPLKVHLNQCRQTLPFGSRSGIKRAFSPVPNRQQNPLGETNKVAPAVPCCFANVQ